jgi:hypothetical protein
VIATKRLLFQWKTPAESTHPKWQDTETFSRRKDEDYDMQSIVEVITSALSSKLMAGHVSKSLPIKPSAQQEPPNERAA